MPFIIAFKNNRKYTIRLKVMQMIPNDENSYPGVFGVVDPGYCHEMAL